MNCGKQLIFLLRHGKPDFPDERPYIYGHTDYPLAKDGVRQAKRIGKALSKIKMHSIISSDLSRAAETADIVAGLQAEKTCEVRRDARLREINMGQWDGVARESVAANFPELFAARAFDFANIAPPGGESFTDLQKRGIETFYSILGKENPGDVQNILLVAHGGIFWTILCKLFDLPLSDRSFFCFDFCALHLIEYTKKPKAPSAGNFRLIRYNWSPGLENYMGDMA